MKNYLLILPLLFLFACQKEDDVQPQQTINVQQCQSQYNEIMAQYNADMTQIYDIWQTSPTLQCSWFELANRNVTDAANAAASQLTGCMGWQTIGYLPCPPR